MEGAKITRLKEFQDIPIPQKLLRVEVSEQVVLDAKEQLAKRFSSFIPIEREAEAGDIIVLKMESEKSSCQGESPVCQSEEIHVNLGLGFVDPQIEQALYGMKQGEEKIIRLSESRENDVKICVQEIYRRETPKLTDERLASLNLDGFEGVKTVEEYCRIIYEEERDACLEEAKEALYDFVIQLMINGTEADISKELLDDAADKYLEEIYQELAEDIESPTESDVISYVHEVLHKKASTMEEAMRGIRKECTENIKRRLIAEYYAAQNSEELGRETYEKRILRWEEETGMTPDELRTNEWTGYEAYMERADYLYLIDEVLPDYYEGQFVITSVA